MYITEIFADHRSACQRIERNRMDPAEVFPGRTPSARWTSGYTMQDYIYSVIAFLAMVIHLIINFDMLPGRKVVGAHALREYRIFLTGVLRQYMM